MSDINLSVLELTDSAEYDRRVKVCAMCKYWSIKCNKCKWKCGSLSKKMLKYVGQPARKKSICPLDKW